MRKSESLTLHGVFNPNPSRDPSLNVFITITIRLANVSSDDANLVFESRRRFYKDDIWNRRGVY